MANVLVVDDDRHIVRLITLFLQREGFITLEAYHGREALQQLEAGKVDLVILDIMMPEMDGWDLCRQIKEHYDIPVLMVTAQGETGQKIKGFELGTDDYLVKPFDPLELVARVRALLKRYKIATSHLVQVGSCMLDQSSHRVRIADEEESTLPLKEFELLFKLASYPGQIFTRDQLIQQIWGIDYEGDERTVDVHVKRLRERFREETARFRISTVRGLGYRLEVLE
ncbi:response regulator transcription factor [Paenibacillus doosanensis]|uniref:response regulator transcription factor n=1 Tax=Paenibacillus doosanensis TaxID=1229154 RepID=UPI002180375D|nr:response regulator transcription factor [Paenibacillus doosanensis]MCS7459050.1 response regulator transcription factor [Paenibacillus doosanensis]